VRGAGWLLIAGATFILGGCSKSGSSEAQKETAPAASATSAAAHSAGPTASASSSAGQAATHTGAASKWGGTYKSAAGTLYVPHDAPNGKDWAAVKWTGDESTAGLGEGAISIAIDEAGRVSGTLEGPLGPASVNGSVSEKQLTAQIERTNPDDQGFTGTLTGTMGADAIDGTMHLSLGRANVLRTSTFSLRKK
jgi:hypothetical protein